MTSATTLKGQLNTATSLIAGGKFSEAEMLLRQIGADPGKSALGPATAWGEPRRLHSAWLKLAKARKDEFARIALQYHLVPPPMLLTPLFKVGAEGRVARVQAAARAVPQVVHQIWIGPAPPPETTDVWRNHSIRQGWEYRLWDEAALRDLAVDQHPVYRAMVDGGDYPGAVDVARYHVLLEHGGLYLDCDWLPVRDAPFESGFPMAGLSTLAEITPRITETGSPFLNNSVIAAPPGHPAFSQLLDVLPAVHRELPKGPAWWVTGPLVFTLAARAGPVAILDAGLSGGAVAGTREAADAAIHDLRKRDDPAYLLAWKPWGNSA